MLLLLRPGTKAPADANGVPIEKPKERIERLMQRLQKERVKIVVPTPALSETLVRAGTEASIQIVEYINKYAVFRVEPFDERAAIELAIMSREALGAKGKRGGSTAVWAKVKFDCQIIAIAKVVGATEIYSDDGDIATLAKQANMKPVGLADLPLPAEDAQFNLNLEGHADAAAPPPDDEEDRGKPGGAPPPP
jgi:predicted nucleic acid-binding protein